MEITYKITEVSVKNLERFPWIKSNFPLGEVGSRDDREVTRLLENTHYPHLVETLEQIDKYGSQSGEIGENILACNDSMVFSRSLAELNLFSHLCRNLNSKVTPIRRIQNKKSPDISVRIDDYEALIEIYSPMDFYGYQIFWRLLTSCIKNLETSIGFNISIASEANNPWCTCDFPQFREIYAWLDRFRDSFLNWLKTAGVGDTYDTDSPTGSVKLKIRLESIKQGQEGRSISWGDSKSTDTILYFRIDDPAKFAGTEWGVKIRDKFQRQQAGGPCDKVIRILAINFALAETPDLSFLNDLEYHANLDANIKHLASGVEPYPPYDIVLPCKVGIECGFGHPINLSGFSDTFIDRFLAKINLNIPIKEIQIASEEQMKALRDSLKNALDVKF